MDIIYLIQQKGILETLLYLFNFSDGKRKVDIRTDLGLNPKTAMRSHNLLMKYGFLKIISHKDKFNSITYAINPIFLSSIKKIKHVLEDSELQHIKECEKIEYQQIFTKELLDS
jgi:hypothetical protein